MRRNIAKRKKDVSTFTKNFIGIILSSSIGFTSIIIFTLLSSLILSKTPVLTNSLLIYFIASVAIGSLLTGFVASKKCEFKGLISGALASLPLIFYITIIMLIFSKGRLINETIILFIGILIFSISGGIISANTKRRK